jgi:uncharacterized protein
MLAEAMYLIARYATAQDALTTPTKFRMESCVRIEEHIGAIRKLIQKYRDTPMSPADACIVRMAEIYDRHVVLTLDSDFSLYRKHARASLTSFTQRSAELDQFYASWSVLTSDVTTVSITHHADHARY